MNGTCTAEFIRDSFWPIHVTIDVASQGWSFNITRLASNKLELFLRDKHIINVVLDTEQNCIISFNRFNDIANIEIISRISNKAKQYAHSIEIDNDLARDLANKIDVLMLNPSFIADSTTANNNENAADWEKRMRAKKYEAMAKMLGF